MDTNNDAIKKHRLEVIEEMAFRKDFEHNIYTPESLVNQLVDKLTIQQDNKVLVLFNVEVVISLLHTYNIPKENITLYSECDLKERIAHKMGINYIKELNTDMKFDVCLANPPFSLQSGDEGAGNGSKKLYPKFYKLITEFADQYAVIMPDSSNKLMKDHNNLIASNATSYESLSKAFGEQGISIKCAAVYKEQGKDPIGEYGAKEYKSIFKGGPLNMTTFKNRFGNHGDETRTADGQIEIFHKINTKQGVVTKFANRSSNIKPIERGYAVIIPQAMCQVKYPDIVIVESNGNNYSAFNGIRYCVCNTLEEANEIKAWLMSNEFTESAASLLQRHGVLPVTDLNGLYIKQMVETNVE